MKRKLNFSQLVGFVAISVFLSTEIVVAAGASVWAFSGLFHLGAIATDVFAVIAGLISLAGIWKVTVLAYEAQTDPDNA